MKKTRSKSLVFLRWRRTHNLGRLGQVSIEYFDGDAAMIKGNDTIPMLLHHESFKDVYLGQTDAEEIWISLAGSKNN